MDRISCRTQFFSALALLFVSAGACAQYHDSPDGELQRLAQSSLEDLMKIPVVSVSGTPQSRVSTPAAVYVISAEDIRRSGNRTVAEVLRMVPGMFVGRINSSSWLVGSRGLTGSTLTANRYLVLVDGRQVYDPLISVTFWDTTDVVLADIERIEVVRGPGATLWGANAMNGVINIVTKPASQTVGTLAQVGVGSNSETELDLRQGVALSDASWLRIWGKYAGHGDFAGPQDASLHDQWSSARGGFRYDRNMDDRTDVNLQGDAYSFPTAMESVQIPIPGADRKTEQVTNNNTISGANLMFHVYSGFGLPSGWRVRAYVDQTRRDATRYAASRQTADVDFRAWSDWNENNNLVWGAEYLWTHDDIRNGPVLFLEPDQRSWAQVNAFVQNTTEIAKDKLFLMLGSKFTYHDFVGYEPQPNVRLWWTPNQEQTFWASISRPVRIPSRFEENGTLVLGYADVGTLTTGKPNGFIIPLSVSGDENLRPEELVAYEAGHRYQISSRWLFESSLFYNDYRRLIEPAPTILGKFTDVGSGSTYGVELNTNLQATEHWRLEASYSYLRTRIDGPVYQFEEKSSPQNMAQLHSYLDIGESTEFNAAAYYVDRIPQLGISSYTRLDLGFTWHLNPRTRLELWGQNLLDTTHREASGAQVPRGVMALVSFDFGQH